MKQRKAQEQVLPRRGKPRVRVQVDGNMVTVRIPWAVVDKVMAEERRKQQLLDNQTVVDNLGDMGYGGDER